MKSMLKGPTVSPAPELSSGVMGVMGSGSGHDGVTGRMRELVEKPKMKPARSVKLPREAKVCRRGTYRVSGRLYLVWSFRPVPVALALGESGPTSVWEEGGSKKRISTVIDEISYKGS